MNDLERSRFKRKIKNIKQNNLFELEKFSHVFGIVDDEEFNKYKDEIENFLNKIINNLNIKKEYIDKKEKKEMTEEEKKKLKRVLNKILRENLFILHNFESKNTLEENEDFQEYFDKLKIFFNDLIRELK